MNTMQTLLQRIFNDLDDLTDELKQFDAALTSLNIRPLAECGASDKIKMAVAILRIQKLIVPTVINKEDR